MSFQPSFLNPTSGKPQHLFVTTCLSANKDYSIASNNRVSRSRDLVQLRSLDMMLKLNMVIIHLLIYLLIKLTAPEGARFVCYCLLSLGSSISTSTVRNAVWQSHSCSLLSSVKQIMRVTMSSSWKADKIEEIYSNDGTEISASSSVVVYGSNSTMLVGSIQTDAYFCGP